MAGPKSPSTSKNDFSSAAVEDDDIVLVYSDQAAQKFGTGLARVGQGLGQTEAIFTGKYEFKDLVKEKWPDSNIVWHGKASDIEVVRDDRKKFIIESGGPASKP